MNLMKALKVQESLVRKMLTEAGQLQMEKALVLRYLQHCCCTVLLTFKHLHVVGYRLAWYPD